MSSVDQFCLKWNNFQTNVLQAFKNLQSSEDLCDVTLTCEGVSIKAHKFILSAFSPYFRDMFKENPCHHPIVILTHIKQEDLCAILNFMYRGEVMINKDQLQSFFTTAEILNVSGLQGLPLYTQTEHNRKRPKSKTPEPAVDDNKRTRAVEEKASTAAANSDNNHCDNNDEEKNLSILERSLMKTAEIEPPPLVTIKTEEEALDEDEYPPDMYTVNMEVPHHSSHSGNCPHCGEEYSNQSSLKYHVRLLHSDLLNMFCCHLCPQSFSHREGYRKHMLEIHSVRP